MQEQGNRCERSNAFCAFIPNAGMDYFAKAATSALGMKKADFMALNMEIGFERVCKL